MNQCQHQIQNKIKELEELMIKKDNELEVVKQELEEEKEITGKAIEEINEKDEDYTKTYRYTTLPLNYNKDVCLGKLYRKRSISLCNM